MWWVGLGTIVSRASRVTDGTLLAASEAVAALVDLSRPGAGLLVWSDHDQTKLSYTAPAALAARYDLTADLAERLSGIDPLTDAVIAS